MGCENGERGVVVCENPLIMRCIAAHCYVPILGSYELIEAEFDTTASIRAELVERIRRYLTKPSEWPTSPTTTDTPTGCTGTGVAV